MFVRTAALQPALMLRHAWRNKNPKNIPIKAEKLNAITMPVIKITTSDGEKLVIANEPKQANPTPMAPPQKQITMASVKNCSGTIGNAIVNVMM